ncbi:MAG: response regulator [Coriobacteriales bacterium]|jgi:signal transduction histidine kinase/ActR/RegA family two-component response regulator|nr:response regulator [Coriobacteriales bacterium]
MTQLLDKTLEKIHEDTAVREDKTARENKGAAYEDKGVAREPSSDELSLDEPSPDALLDENKLLGRKVKRLERELEKERTLLSRYRSNNEAKKQFSEIVLAERSRLELQMNLLLQNSRDFILFFDAQHRLILCTDSLLEALGVPGIGLLKGKNFKDIFNGLVPDEVIAAVEDFGDFEADKHLEAGKTTDQATGKTTGKTTGKAANKTINKTTGEPGESSGNNRGESHKTFERQFTTDLKGSGEARDYSLEVSVMRDSEGVRQGWLFFFYDNTDFVQAKCEAEQANAAKSEFLAKISHDIRSPMNAVIGLAQMLSATGLDTHQRELLTKIQTSSDGLLALINDLLDLSKIEAGKLEVIDDYFDFKDFLSELSSVFEVLLKQKELALHTHFAADIPEIVYTDAKRLQQILTNLVNNAYKYTPSGWVDFSVSRTRDGLVRLEVCDTGIGIREDELNKLFTAFEQLDIKRNRDITGTGLGLAITKQLVELMGGSIEVQSVYGEGSTFSVVLPLKEGARADLPHDSGTYREFTAPDARILIVDDVAVNTEIAEFMLEPFEVQVETAADGQQALDMVQREHFDLILMDHMMPVMDGVEATKLIRELDGPNSKVAIIAMTANAVSGVVEMFLAAGFDGYISKPMDAALLSMVLYEHLPKNLIHE